MIVAGIGIVVFAILVGMVTDSVETAVRNVDGGSSKVTVSDHVLVCGWNKRVSPILKGLHSIGPRTKVVVLASSSEKRNMMDELRNEFTDKERKDIKLFYRPGIPVLPEDLSRVAANKASKILLVGSDPEKHDADRKVLSRALALRENLPNFEGDIVAELNDPRDEKLLKSILGGAAARSVQTVNSDRLLFRFMAQAIQQPGLAEVVGRLMGEDPETVFHIDSVASVAPHLLGTRCSTLGPTSFPGAILCGYFDEVAGDVKVGLNNSSHVLEATSKLFLLGKAEKRESPPLLSRPDIVRSTRRSDFRVQRKPAQSILVCGWRTDMYDMLAELDIVLAPGLKVVIMDDDAPTFLVKKLKTYPSSP